MYQGMWLHHLVKLMSQKATEFYRTFIPRDLDFSDITFYSIFLKIYIFHPIKSEDQKWKCNQNDFSYCKFQETALRITVKFLG